MAEFGDDRVTVDPLYLMLEGQVAVLSSGALSAEDAAAITDALFSSEVYRDDQHSFMLYPNRDLPGFLARNRVADEQALAIPLLQQMLDERDGRVLLRDDAGCIRFNADFSNAADVEATLDDIGDDYEANDETARRSILGLYEDTFNHRAFTGRSGTMFGFEGLGSVYWHMVAKLLLAVQENFFDALDQHSRPTIVRKLGELYYRIRSGIGFNKSPSDYGAFPTDPYSHTPKHSGARQPGMTGQVKEEILTRFGELGIRVRQGAFSIVPSLLRRQEFSTQAHPFRYLDVHNRWRTLTLPANSLGFTWCQIPFVYVLDDAAHSSIVAEHDDGKFLQFTELRVSASTAAELFRRSGHIRQITVTIRSDQLFDNIPV